MSGELIERLHDHARNVGGDPSFDRLGGSEACEIADEITRLRAELSSLRGEGGWVSYRVERAHYLDEGNAAVLCDRLPSPVTLVLKNPVRCEGDYFPWDFRDELPASLADRGGTSAAHSDVIGRLVGALEKIATVDMGGGFLGAQACRKVAAQALASLPDTVLPRPRRNASPSEVKTGRQGIGEE